MAISRRSTGNNLGGHDPVGDLIDEMWNRHLLRKTILTDTPPSDNDTLKAAQLCVQQTTSFLDDSSAEIRNRIYEAVFAQHDRVETAMIIASPMIDKGMTLATQPAFTRVCRQLRAESLAMFYVNTTFVAYLVDWDIRDLCDWVHCIGSGGSLPEVTVHIKLLDGIKCEYQLLKLMRLWRDLEHNDICLKVHDISPKLSVPRFDQRELFKRAIDDAEDLWMDGDKDELRLREVCSLAVLEVARYLEGCAAVSYGRYVDGCRGHGVSAE